MGTNMIYGPKFFEFVEDTLGSSHSTNGAFYSYVVHPDILSIYVGGKSFGVYKHFKEGKEHEFFSTVDKEHAQHRKIVKGYYDATLDHSDVVECIEKLGPYTPVPFCDTNLSLSTYIDPNTCTL